MGKTFARSSLCAQHDNNDRSRRRTAYQFKRIRKGDWILSPGRDTIERGQTDKQYDWVTQFEEKGSGCAVRC